MEAKEVLHIMPFSILERIDVGETPRGNKLKERSTSLSVSSNGSTWVKHGTDIFPSPTADKLSVSSNGSTWVKPQ